MSKDVQGILLEAYRPEDAWKMGELQRRCWVRSPDIGLLPDGCCNRHEWRRHGLARYTVTQALRYVQERVPTCARQQVAGDKEGALSLYRLLGFKRRHEEITLGARLRRSTEPRQDKEDRP